MEKLSFTLYEIFGYFLPGTVAVLSLAILFWAFFAPSVPVPVESFEVSKFWYFGLVALSYYAGHVLQEISRSWFKNPDDSISSDKDPEMLPVTRYAHQQVSEALGIKQPEILGSSALVRVCDEVGIQYGQIGDRDVFVYREGFYRGSMAAFVMLDLALLVRWAIPGSAFYFRAEQHFITRWELAFVIAVVTRSAMFLFRRYKRFAALRAMHGVLAFVSIAGFQALGRKGNKESAGAKALAGQ